MNKDAPIGKVGELIMRTVVSGFGFLSLVWILTLSFSFGNDFFGFLVPPIVVFFLTFPYSGIVLVGFVIILFCFEMFYFRIKRPFYFYFYYFIVVPMLSSASALSVSSSILLP